jgi:hypothetical protein
MYNIRTIVKLMITGKVYGEDYGLAPSSDPYSFTLQDLAA